MRQSVYVFASLMLAACSGGPDGEATQSYWEDQIQALLTGADEEDLAVLLDSLGVSEVAIGQASQGPSRVLVLEDIEDTGWVCSGWRIMLTYDLGADGTIEGVEVESHGMCL